MSTLVVEMFFGEPAAGGVQVPDAITDLDALGDVEQVLLTWTEPDSGGAAIISYEVERSTTSDSAGFTTTAILSPTGSHTDTDVVALTQYWYRVRAANTAGDADWSNVVTATPTEVTDPPEAIDDLTATTVSSTAIDLAWSAPTSTETITSYDIQRSATSDTGPWSDVEIDLSPTTTYSDTGLTADTTYWYRVRATSSEGDGPWSNIDSDTTDAGAASSPDIQSGHTGTPFASTTTSWVVDLPSTVGAGDDLVVVLAITSSAIRTITPPSGWSSQQKDTQGSNLTTEWFTKDTVDGTEDGGTATFTLDVASTGAAYSFAVSGHDGNGPIFGTAAGSAGSTTPDPPSNTHGLGSVPILAVAFTGARDDDATVSAYPSGYTYITAEQQGGGGTNNSAEIGIAALQTTASSADPGTFTLSESENWVAQTVVWGPAGGGGGSPGTAAPTIPSFLVDLTITAGQNVKSLIEAQPAGAHILLAAGTHNNCENVKLKTDQHVRLATGCILEGSGKGYCFRPLNQAVTGVAIGGDPSGARPIIRNYGNGTSSQGFGAIMGRVDEPLNLYPAEPNFVYQDTDGWVIYHLDLEENSSNGIKMGSNWTIFDVEAHGHTVTGINGDRIVGGLIHSCLLYWNALNPASGSGANGANIKVTWVNADEGRTDITPIDRTKAQFIVSNCTFEALDRNGGPGDTNIGMWFDLDCKDCLVEFCSFDDHPSVACFAEGCNDIEYSNLTVRNSDGYGAAAGENFINGGLAVGESTNCYVHDCTIIDCTRAIVIRQSNRSGDWYNSNNASFVNFAWPPGSGGVRYWIDNDNRATAISSTARSNMWTSGHVIENNTLIDCGRVVINEGTDSGGMSCVGSVVNGQLAFAGNDYSGSSSIEFYNKNNTPLANFAAWQALGYDV